MHRSDVAEFVLSRFTNRDRATAIVGDLLEVAPESARFWFAVARTAAAFSLRPAAGILAAMAAEYLIRFLYGASAFSSRRIDGFSQLFSMCGLLFALVTANAAVRRGLTEPITAISVGLAVLTTGAALLRSMVLPFVLVGGSAELLVLVLLCTRWRRATVAVLASSAVAFLTSYTAWKCLYPLIGMKAHSYLPLWFIAAQAFAPALGAAVALSWSGWHKQDLRPAEV